VGELEDDWPSAEAEGSLLESLKSVLVKILRFILVDEFLGMKTVMGENFCQGEWAQAVCGSLT